MTHILLLCFCVLALACSVLAQSVTVTDAAGNTIVEVITVDPSIGLPTTIPVQTIPAGQPAPVSPALPSTPAPPTAPVVTPTATPTPTPTPVQPTIPDGQQGPVGAPTPITGPAGAIVYTYTTTDANGAFTAIVDTFTPTSPASTPFTPTGSGTILNYSQYLSLVGTNTVLPQISAGHYPSISFPLLSAGIAVAVGFAGGLGLYFA
ncbi:hypothetical protein BDW22DRAFT_1368756 [Trametopsis cervina]|nr:hypothetical protein BDW22DRAFT_1368756 [Trametopsis cervina]